MKHRSVVANYLFRGTPGSNQQVALFKRSDHPNVRSYQGKYAPISGSIEDDDPSPQAAAEREIKEETQLISYQDITIAFVGQSFSFQDEQAQRSWTVYPFGWDLIANESKITIDWEHSGWKWFYPSDAIAAHMVDQCVPRLRESLRRVYYGADGIFGRAHKYFGIDQPAGQVFIDGLRGLRKNTIDGARTLATNALQCLRQMLRMIPVKTQVDASCLTFGLTIATFHLIYSARPSMNAAISAATLAAVAKIVKQKNDSNFVELAIDVLQEEILHHETTLGKVGTAFAEYIRKDAVNSNNIEDAPNPTKIRMDPLVINIFTISSSSTVLAALKHILTAGRFQLDVEINLLVFESRPACEGADMVAKLIAHLESPLSAAGGQAPPKVNITIAPESHAPLLISGPCVRQTDQIRIVLLGADRVTPMGHIVNKMGSAILVDAATSTNLGTKTQIIVLTETDKISVPEPKMLMRYDEYRDCLTGRNHKDYIASMHRTLRDRELAAIQPERHPAAEVFSAWSEEAQATIKPYITNNGTDTSRIEIEVENNYFEAIGGSAITAYICETGRLTLTDILDISLDRAKLEKELFEDLYTD